MAEIGREIGLEDALRGVGLLDGSTSDGEKEKDTAREVESVEKI